ncbi:MAG TPA: dTDP-4-dehydrorhamnose reductase [Acidimicrobiales bacterium]|nr:dTDP-4-dehydrorhamnose reductase [Acidimicrobiales bacterium]
MRVLVTGAGGQLGREVVDAFAGHEVVAADQPTVDVGDRERVLQLVGGARPEAVVHTAAWTDVDACESDPDQAFRINALGTRNVVEAARLVGARVCYVSTDYVFDGAAGRPYTEWDTPNPISVYGRSKLGGEAEVGPEGTVVRTSWLCGPHGRNFVRTVLEKATQGSELRVVADQHGAFTHAGDLATMIRRLVVERRTGVYHVTNQGTTTWYRLACDALAIAGLDSGLVHPIETSQMDPPRAAARPAFAVLDNAALRLSGVPLLPDHQDALRRLVPTLLDGTS